MEFIIWQIHQNCSKKICSFFITFVVVVVLSFVICFVYDLKFWEFVCSWILVILQPDLNVIGVELIWSLLNLEKDDITLKRKKIQKKCALMHINYTIWIYFSLIHIFSELISVIFALEITLNEIQENDILRHFFHFGNIITLVKMESKSHNKYSKYGKKSVWEVSFFKISAIFASYFQHLLYHVSDKLFQYPVNSAYVYTSQLKMPILCFQLSAFKGSWG